MQEMTDLVNELNNGADEIYSEVKRYFDSQWGTEAKLRELKFVDDIPYGNYKIVKIVFNAKQIPDAFNVVVIMV